MKSEKRYDRLPKWVQSEIIGLRNKVSFWKNKVISHSEKDSNTSYSSGIEQKTFLPMHSNIQFYLPTKYGKNYIEVNHYYPARNTLRISSRSGGLLVRPVADNVIEIRLRED